MFKELTSPIPSWSRYGRTVLWHVEVVEGKGHLGVDGDTGATFIDSGFTFSFATIDEAWDAAQRYYTWYKMVYPYALVTKNDGTKYCVNWDGSPIVHNKELSETVSEIMEFI